MKNEINNLQANKTYYDVSTDILFIFKSAYRVNWQELRESSIYRILYFASVFYSFAFTKSKNPFSTYKFIISNRGPYSSEVSNALLFLIKDFLTETDEVFEVINPDITNLLKIEGSQEKFDWIDNVIKILAIYGESRIYDFIFKDPEYQRAIKSNTAQGLDTSIENSSVLTLNKFRKVFEQNVEEAKKASPKVYLQLYFDYVFSKILKREF